MSRYVVTPAVLHDLMTRAFVARNALVGVVGAYDREGSIDRATDVVGMLDGLAIDIKEEYDRASDPARPSRKLSGYELRVAELQLDAIEWEAERRFAELRRSFSTLPDDHVRWVTDYVAEHAAEAVARAAEKIGER